MKKSDQSLKEILENTIQDLRNVLRMDDDITEDERDSLIECIHSLTEMYLLADYMVDDPSFNTPEWIFKKLKK